MIAQFPGKCWVCKEPIKPGIDIYDKATKRNWHRSCEPQEPYDYEAAERIAVNCHFIRFDEFTAGVFRDWSLLLLSGTYRDPAGGAGRMDNDSHQQQGSLFRVPEKENTE